MKCFCKNGICLLNVVLGNLRHLFDRRLFAERHVRNLRHTVNEKRTKCKVRIRWNHFKFFLFNWALENFISKRIFSIYKFGYMADVRMNIKTIFSVACIEKDALTLKRPRFFWIKVFLKTRPKSESIEPLTDLLAYVQPKLWVKNPVFGKIQKVSKKAYSSTLIIKVGFVLGGAIPLV